MLGMLDEYHNYYESEINLKGDVEVPLRPSHYYDWVDDSWVERTSEREADEKAALLKQLTYAVQKQLDTVAQEHGYDNIVSACSYAGAVNPFQAEGIAFITWRGDVWAACYSILADVENQVRTTPTEQELLAELPTLVI